MFVIGRATLLAGMIAVPMLVLGAPASQAASPAANQKGGEVVQTGWWSRSNEAPPETGVLAPPEAPAVGVPAGSLPVTVMLGDRERVSAIEFSLKGAPDSTVRSVVVKLRESSENGGSANASSAAISACRITEAFWTGGQNGRWKDRPDFDCDAGSVPGVRDDQGVWTFDVTSLAADWLASDRSASAAVALVGETEGENGEPLNFQIAFEGTENDGIGLVAGTAAPSGSGGGNSSGDLGTTPGGSAGDGGAGDGDGAGAPPSLGGGGDASFGGDGAGDLAVDDGALLEDGLDADEAAAAAPVAAPEAGSGTSSTTVAPVAVSRPSWHDGIARPGVLLVPLVVALACAAMVAMGPAGQPTAVTGGRGVSRALDRLRAAGVGLAAKVNR